MTSNTGNLRSFVSASSGPVGPGGATGSTGPTGPAGGGSTGPTGPAGSSASPFEGICVHLDTDLVYTADTDVTGYAIDFSPGQFYTNANFNLTTGEYTVPEDGYYTILLSQGNDVFNFYVVYDGTALQGPNGGDGSGLLQFTPYLLNGNVVTIRASTSGTIPKLNGNSCINYCLSITKQGGALGPTGDPGSLGQYSFTVSSETEQTIAAANTTTAIALETSIIPAAISTAWTRDGTNKIFTCPQSGYYRVSYVMSIFIGDNTVTQPQYAAWVSTGSPINTTITRNQGPTVQDHLMVLTGESIVELGLNDDLSLNVIADTDTATTGFQVGQPAPTVTGDWSALPNTTATLTVICLGTF